MSTANLKQRELVIAENTAVKPAAPEARGKLSNKELEACILRLQNGDIHALDEIYRATNKAIFATAIAILKDYALAEDAMQETYLRFRKNVGGYRMGNNATAYLVTICRNVCLNMIKRRKREMFVDYNENESLYGEYKMEDHHDVDDNIKLILQCLDDCEREILLMKVYGGYKHREIAVMLNKPLGTVLWLYNRAVNKLKKHVVDHNLL
jgi:RNA polymerase sigma factor, sigma-70 family